MAFYVYYATTTLTKAAKILLHAVQYAVRSTQYAVRSTQYAVHLRTRFIGLSVVCNRNQAKDHGLRTVQRTAYPT